MSSRPRAYFLYMGAFALAMVAGCGSESGSGGAEGGAVVAASGENPCAEQLPYASASADFAYTPEDVRALAAGEWSGRFPGSEIVDAFDFVIRVDPRDGPDIVSTAQTDEQGDVLEEFRERCAGLCASAAVTVDASDDRFDVESGSICVRGRTLSNPAENPNEALGGYLQLANGTFMGAPKPEFSFVLGQDGELWVSVQVDGEGAKFVKATR